MFVNDEVKQELQTSFAEITRKVTILVFTREHQCDTCRDTRTLLEEVCAVHPLVSLSHHSMTADAVLAKQYGITLAPGIVFLDENGNDTGIRFFGLPGGYEFTALVSAITLVGTGNAGFAPELISQVMTISKPVTMKVFVTPTCPYCPKAVINAHRLAYLNPMIRAEMIEATAFQEAAGKYKVRGVPKTIINEKAFVEGAVPESQLLEKILQQLQDTQ